MRYARTNPKSEGRPQAEIRKVQDNAIPEGDERE